MTAEIVVPGSKTLVLDKPEIRADLVDATDKPFIAWTSYEGNGFLAIWGKNIKEFKIILRDEDKNNFAYKNGIRNQKDTIIQLQGGSFIQAT